MNATGLQLGDIVYRISDDGEKHKEVVVSLGFKGSYHLINEMNADLYEPIPLTEKLLDAIGFVEETLYYISIDGRVIVRKNIYNNSDKKWYVHIDNNDMDTIETCFVDYLHELQHHYASADIEFEFLN